MCTHERGDQLYLFYRNKFIKKNLKGMDQIRTEHCFKNCLPGNCLNQYLVAGKRDWLNSPLRYPLGIHPPTPQKGRFVGLEVWTWESMASCFHMETWLSTSEKGGCFMLGPNVPGTAESEGMTSSKRTVCHLRPGFWSRLWVWNWTLVHSTSSGVQLKRRTCQNKANMHIKYASCSPWPSR